ncbi:MAG: GxxExxY protein [Polyangiales bacterium]
MQFDSLSREVIGACVAVHRELGPGLLESAYLRCLSIELGERGIRHRAEVPIPIHYKGHELSLEFRADLIVEERLIVEAKSVDQLHDVHTAQLTTYLRFSGLTLGLLVNFNTARVTSGIRRVVNGHKDLPTASA